MPRFGATILIAGLFLSTTAAARAQNLPNLPQPADIKVDYDQHVRPILTSRCFGCHGPTQQQSGLRLDLRQNALRGGDYGVVIVPGNSAESKLILRVTGAAAGLQMPPTGPLSADEIGVLRAWIDQGADMPGRAVERVVDKRPMEPRVQALIDAIHRHDRAAVRKAVTADRMLVGSADEGGSTPLMHAAYAGTFDIMNVLLEAGADVNARNNRQATALHWAVADPAKLRLLVAKGADLDAKTVEGRTVLHEAAIVPAGAAVVKLLLEAGADVKLRSITGETPLFQAAGASVESTRLLLESGADANATSGTGTTPLMSARSAGAVGLLIARGANVNARSKKNENALANAADRGDLESVRLLLEKDADVNVADYRGYTPLMFAAHYDRDVPELIQILLAHGANPHATGEGETASGLAAKRGETALARTLRDAEKNAPVIETGRRKQ